MSIEKENKRKIGLAVHYYLSFIKYASTSERELATKMTLAKYGNMFGKDKMANIFETTDKFISKYSDDPVHGNIFNKKYKVFLCTLNLPCHLVSAKFLAKTETVDSTKVALATTAESATTGDLCGEKKP